MTPTALFCNDLRVGDLSDTHFTDDTWFATVRVSLTDDSVLASRVRSFIALCLDWHARIDTDPDASEFDAFTDLINDSRWSVASDDASTESIHLAPSFLPGGEITWRPE